MTMIRSLFLCLSLVPFTSVIHAQMAAVVARPVNQMVLISEGHFTMGSNNGPDDEKPEHQVFVKSFSIDLLPVSNADFAKFLNARGLRNNLSESFYDEDDRDARIHKQNSIWDAEF